MACLTWLIVCYFCPQFPIFVKELFSEIGMSVNVTKN
jgi:hypothetical protein